MPRRLQRKAGYTDNQFNRSSIHSFNLPVIRYCSSLLCWSSSPSAATRSSQILQYTSRDTTALLSSGDGGVSDIRHAVERYDEKKPLFGFLNLRSRKVVLKIVPDGTSRLFLVRLSVQFSTVLDTFEHDAVYELSQPSDLNELALNAHVFPEEAALPRTPLEEISENDENKQDDKPGASLEPVSVPIQAVRHGGVPETHSEHHTRDKSLAIVNPIIEVNKFKKPGAEFPLVNAAK
ncbi:hypothetical protein KEM56_000332 [Ascosphaera pollenicola]|nr:hypothetical protein KEM56_000332 [Ascosphaera pollenicola]